MTVGAAKACAVRVIVAKLHAIDWSNFNPNLRILDRCIWPTLLSKNFCCREGTTVDRWVRCIRGNRQSADGDKRAPPSGWRRCVCLRSQRKKISLKWVRIALFRDKVIYGQAKPWCLYVSDSSWSQSVQSTYWTKSSKGSTGNQTENDRLK